MPRKVRGGMGQGSAFARCVSYWIHTCPHTWHLRQLVKPLTGMIPLLYISLSQTVVSTQKSKIQSVTL